MPKAIQKYQFRSRKNEHLNHLFLHWLYSGNCWRPNSLRASAAQGHFSPSPPVADLQLSYREADGVQGLSRKIGDGRLWPFSAERLTAEQKRSQGVSGHGPEPGANVTPSAAYGCRLRAVVTRQLMSTIVVSMRMAGDLRDISSQGGLVGHGRLPSVVACET